MARRTGIEGIEPANITVPKMDRVSVTFALALDSFVVDISDEEGLAFLTCTHCTEVVCEVEHGDSLRVLLNTALAHTC